MTAPTKTPAAQLAAVLNLLRYECVDDVDGLDEETRWLPSNDRGGSKNPTIARLCHDGEGYSLEMDPNSKDDLARVVAMLSPEQRERFDLRMADITKGGAMEQDGRYPRVPASAVLTAPASVWLAALAAATGVK